MGDNSRIQQRILALPPELEPLRVHALNWEGTDDELSADGVACICRTPKVAPMAFRFRIYPGALPQWLAAKQNQYVSKHYRNILSDMNGCFAYGMKLYGLAPSMQGDPPLQNRMVLQPLDLSNANEHWKREFKSTRIGKLLHFGGRHYSRTENVGYFEASGGRIVSVRKNGEIVGEWDSFLPFLNDELQAAADYDVERQKNRT
jgi:hypothetical protein